MYLVNHTMTWIKTRSIFAVSGVSHTPYTINRGVRSLIANGYLEPAMTRPNLHVATDALVHKVRHIIQNKIQIFSPRVCSRTFLSLNVFSKSFISITFKLKGFFSLWFLLLLEWKKHKYASTQRKFHHQQFLQMVSRFFLNRISSLS